MRKRTSEVRDGGAANPSVYRFARPERSETMYVPIRKRWYDE